MPAPSPPQQAEPPPTRPRAGRALMALLVLALGYTLYFTAEIVIPIVLALLLAMVLAPVVGWLRRRHLPRALAAGLVTAAVVVGLGVGVELLAAPAAEWLQRAPQSFRELEKKLRPVQEPVAQVKQATEQVERMAVGSDKTPTVKVKSFDLGTVFVVSATMMVAQIVIVVFLLFFMLASGDRMIRALARVPRQKRQRHCLISVARRIKHDVATYLGMITLINLGLGVAAGLAMWALHMPNPALWGALAAILNYIPYAGAITTMIVVGMVGLLTFDELWRGALPILAILLLHVLESDLITPLLVGRRLTLPPMVVFLSLTIWTWMWGIAGAMLAVPLLVILKVAADHTRALAPLSPFLGGTDRRRV